MIHRNAKLICAFLLSLALLLTSCAHKEYQYNRYLLGSQCEVTFICDNKETADLILYEIDQKLYTIDSLLSYFSEYSLVTEINRIGHAPLPPDITELFVLSDSIARITDGLFDISIAPLIELWGFYRRQFTYPDTAQIMRTLTLVDHRRIVVRNDSIMIAPGMKIDLGGIAQGYAADQVAVVLKKHNIASGLINIGGELVAIGNAPEGRPWRIGIKHPRHKGIIETVELVDQGLSTSGDYEKYFQIDNTRYPHIINPNTGFPAQEFASVTIFSENAAYADAIATAVAIMGPEQGTKFLDSLGIHGIIYYEVHNKLQRVEHK
jgi:thiamine biosynthesis lipoprotein